MKDAVKISNKATKICSSDSQEHLFTYVTKIGTTYGKTMRTYLTSFYNGTNKLTKELFYQENINEITENWSRLVTEFENQGGNVAN